MGNVHSRQRYYEVAEDAFLNAEDLQHEFGGPPCQGAILAYIDGAISARRMVHDCTPLEWNEFKRLAFPIYIRWAEANRDKFLCQPVLGRCQYPDEFIHSGACRYRVPLPPGIIYSPVPGPPPGHASHTHGRPGHHGFGGHSGPSNPRPGHRDHDRDYGGSYYGYSENDYEYSEDEDGAVYSDEEDLYARSMSQASDYGFGEGARQGGAGHGGASRGGPNGAHGRASQGRAPNARVVRGDDGTAPSRAPRSGPSGAGAARGGDFVGPGGASRGGAPAAHGRASRSGAARGDDDGAAPAGASRSETPNAGAARGGGAGTRGGTSRGQPPRQPNSRAGVSDTY